MSWFPIGASLFASNIGSEHFIGLAGSGAANGIGVAAFELNACLILQLLGWVFLPVYLASGVCTLPEYMKKRFQSPYIQVYLSLVSLLLYIFTKISVNLYAGALFIESAFRWNIWISIIFILTVTTFISLVGGLAAVIYTDTLQCVIMLVGSTVLSCFAFARFGTVDLHALLSNFSASISPVNMSLPLGTKLIDQLVMASDRRPNYTFDQIMREDEAGPGDLTAMLNCRLPSRNAFIMLGPISDKEIPWLGFLLGQIPGSIWYWCADQMMVQRVLASRSLAHAQGSTLFAGFLKLLPLFLIVLPGMISRVLFTQEIACASPEECMQSCGQASGCSNLAYPKLVMNILPNGLRGALLSVMFAALVSDLTSIFNSASTLFTIDIYKKLRKGAKTPELMIVGRVFIVFMVLVSVLWVPVIQSMQGGRLYVYIMTVSANLSPPIAAVFLLAVLWPRTNAVAAFTALMVGFVVGIVKLVLDFVFREPFCGQVDTRPLILKNFQYMYFAMFSFLLTNATAVALTLFTSKERDEEFTYWGASEMLRMTHPDEIQVEEEKECTMLLVEDHTATVTPTRKRVLKNVLKKMCGLEKEVEEEAAANETKLKAFFDRTRFRQSPRVRRTLLSFLCFICVFTVFMYIFLSTYFPQLEYGPLAVIPALESNMQALEKLQNRNVLKLINAL
ncbi:Sodium/myo-inositol cotransporter [Cichlidogyrus casuarinus]|uniref:Sodium/myo-inositol cotransporter n=1 Tax=Cichlidogyrus casuarinus TaxID=1844966 RepID=A0ABD2QIN5_9PLAT